jgi:hypothetical protein
VNPESMQRVNLTNLGVNFLYVAFLLSGMKEVLPLFPAPVVVIPFTILVLWVGVYYPFVVDD